MSNARQFEIELDDWFKEEVEGTIYLITQKIALYALSGVVLKTPVAEGRARANWGVELGTWTAQVNDNYDKNGMPTINAGQSIIQNSKAYEVVYLSNSLPYINRLENGWSQQAPAGMVTVTLAEIEAMFS